VVSSLGPAATRLISPYADNKLRTDIPALLIGHYAETHAGSTLCSMKNAENVRDLLDHTCIQSAAATNVHSETPTPPLTEIIDLSQQIPQKEENDMEVSNRNIAAQVRTEIDDLGNKSAGPMQPRLARFPKTDFGKQNRAFSATYYDMFPWIKYSIKLDSALCYPCRNFHVEGSFTEDLLIKRGFRDWEKMSEKLWRHAASKSHITNVQKWAAFRDTAATGSVATKLSESYRAEVLQNRKNLAIICEIVLLLLNKVCLSEATMKARHHKTRETSWKCVS
jgi:hypothetical protein